MGTKLISTDNLTIERKERNLKRKGKIKVDRGQEKEGKKVREKYIEKAREKYIVKAREKYIVKARE